MSTTFRHGHGHAVVAFSNELTWSSALDRVGSIDLVVDAYFYGLVELVVSSPSGTCPALDYVLNALALRRAQGVRFRTRIISQASSVAAVLACLGDERVSELCPCQPGLAGVVRVRPISTLAIGECDAVLSDGRFERRQLDRFCGTALEKTVTRSADRSRRVPEPVRARSSRGSAEKAIRS